MTPDSLARLAARWGGQDACAPSRPVGGNKSRTIAATRRTIEPSNDLKGWGGGHRERDESCRGWPGQLAATVSARLSLRYERRVMLLLLLVLVVDYADRTLIGALGPTLQRVFHIGNTELASGRR